MQDKTEYIITVSIGRSNTDDVNNVLFECLDFFFQSAFIHSILFAHKVTNEVGIIILILSAGNKAEELVEGQRTGYIRTESGSRSWDTKEGTCSITKLGNIQCGLTNLKN